MTLQRLQAGFIACLHDQDAALPPRWDARMARGLDVYRNNYRNALMAAMRATFERTLHWVGAEAFDAAAAHHLIAHPPASWTVDDVGAGFAQTTAGLFARDPDVADLVALEWAMHRVFVAADSAVLDLAGFRQATADFAEDDWAAMRLVLQPGLEVVAARTDCVALWRALARETLLEDGRPADPPVLEQAHVAIVWREAWRPVCRMAPAEEGELLRSLAAGASYGALCESLADRHGAEPAVRRAGELLSRWLHAGMLVAAH